MISVDSNNDSDSNENNESPSTTPTPPISSRETTPIACYRFNYHHRDRNFSPDWSSSDENTTFYGDKNSILSSACDADRQLATSEYFKSSCGGYFLSPRSIPDHHHSPIFSGQIQMLCSPLNSFPCIRMDPPLHFI